MRPAAHPALPGSLLAALAALAFLSATSGPAATPPAPAAADSAAIRALAGALEDEAVAGRHVDISPRSVGGLPYAAMDESFRPLSRFPRQSRGRPYTLADTDADGTPELLRCYREGIILVRHDGTTARVVEQFNLPPDYTNERPFADLAAYDADGDGRSEVVATAAHRDGSHWRLWVLDVAAQRVLGDMVLPVYPDGRRQDGVWDGMYTPVGTLDLPGRPRPALIIGCWVGHDVHGRGILAVDPVAGEVLWRRDLDGQPLASRIRIADLEGDDRAEVILVTPGVNNLEGERIHGAGDDSSRVHVLADDGSLRWQRGLEGAGAGADLAVLDLDGDGRLEIVTASSDPHPAHSRLSVWSADGRLLDEWASPAERFLHLAAIDGDGDAPPMVVVVRPGREVSALRWQGGRLARVAGRTIGAAVPHIETADVVAGHPGEEILLHEFTRTLVFDRDLRPLAGVRTEDRSTAPRWALAWPVGGNRTLLVFTDAATGSVSFVPSPFRLHPAWFLGGGVVLAGLAGEVWRRRRSRRAARGELETDPVILRELRLQLLARLAKGSHEKIGALQALRRLVWRMEAEAAVAAAGGARAPASPGGPRGAGGAGEHRAPGEHRARWAGAFRDDTLPRLREIVTLGRRTGAPAHVLATCDEILGDLDRLMADLAASAGAESTEQDAPTDALHDRAARLAQEAEVALQRLRRSVEAEFRADLAAVTDQVLTAQQDALAAAGVTVVLPSVDERPHVAIDPQDLAFVLDNLVGNAIRALRESHERRLEIAWTAAATVVICAVTDTGLGIAPEDREAIFEDGFSDRPGGGYGLARSRRDLALYGGTLRVRESEPGRGTTFELVLPRASEAGEGTEASRESEASAAVRAGAGPAALGGTDPRAEAAPRRRPRR